MKPLSESPTDLAARGEGPGDSAAEVWEQNRAALQVSPEQLETAIEYEVPPVRRQADELVARR